MLGDLKGVMEHSQSFPKKIIIIIVWVCVKENEICGGKGQLKVFVRT